MAHYPTDRFLLKYYLKAMRTLLERQEQSHCVLDMLSQRIKEEDVTILDFFGDGQCLLNEIRDELEGLSSRVEAQEAFHGMEIKR